MTSQTDSQDISHKTQQTIAVIGAMPEEAALIVNNLDNSQEIQRAGLVVSTGSLSAGSLSDIRVVVTVAGMGTVNAASTTQYLIDNYEPEAVIFSGIAGNLTPELHINDVVLGKTLRYWDTDMRMVAQSEPFLEEFTGDSHLLEVADDVLSSMGVKHLSGVIATGNLFVEGDEMTSQIKAKTNANAVEMEGAAVAQVCARNNVPQLVIRALSDNADTEYETFREFDISEYADTAAKIVLNILAKL